MNEITFEEIKKLNEEGKLPQKFSDEELQKIIEIENSGFCSSGCPMYFYENSTTSDNVENKTKDIQEKSYTGLNNYSPLIRKEALNQDNCNIDDNGNFIYKKDDKDIFYGDYGSLTTCGDEMQVWVKIKKQNDETFIDDVKYLCSGCFGALSSASVGAKLIKGMNIKDLNVKDIHEKTQNYLNLPPIKEHCSTYFINAVLKALENYNK